MHLSGLLYQTGHMPARAAPSMSQRTSSPINQHFPAPIPARESARRKIHSEGLRKAPSLLARMNSKRLEGSVSAMRRRREAPEYERLLMTAVRMPSCPHSSRKASTPSLGYGLRGPPAQVLELLEAHVEGEAEALVYLGVQLEAVRLELMGAHGAPYAAVYVRHELGERGRGNPLRVPDGVPHHLGPAGGIVLHRLVAERMAVIEENHLGLIHVPAS